ncbi:MAG: hypothetical protein ACYDD1_10070 [Caulobacteraceae bacterium]
MSGVLLMGGSLGRPWFAHKRYGYGASLPITWEGWVVMALFFAALMAEITFTAGWLRAIVFTVIVCAFIAICALKTEGGIRWRWGDD